MKLWKPWRRLWGYFYVVNTNEHLCYFCNVYSIQEFNFNLLLVKLIYIIDQWCVSWKPVLRCGLLTHWKFKISICIFYFIFKSILLLTLYCEYIFHAPYKSKKNDILFYFLVTYMGCGPWNWMNTCIDLHEAWKYMLYMYELNNTEYVVLMATE